MHGRCDPGPRWRCRQTLEGSEGGCLGSGEGNVQVVLVHARDVGFVGAGHRVVVLVLGEVALCDTERRVWRQDNAPAAAEPRGRRCQRL